MFSKVVVSLLALFLAVTSAGVPGGLIDVDVNRKDVQNALQFAVAQHNKASNDVFISQVAEVTKAQTQVVSGINYVFTVELVRTSCRKGGVENDCPTHSDPKFAKKFSCQWKVWSQPWSNRIELTENNCY